MRKGMATSACFEWHDTEEEDCRFYSEHADMCMHGQSNWDSHSTSKCCSCGGGVQAIGSGLRNELADVRADRADLERSIRLLEMNASGLQDALSEAKQNINAMEAHRAEKASGVLQLRSKVGVLQLQRSALFRNISALEDALLKARQGLDDKHVEIAVLRNDHLQLLGETELIYRRTRLLFPLGCIIASVCAVVIDRACCARPGLRGADVRDVFHPRAAMANPDSTAMVDEGSGSAE